MPTLLTWLRPISVLLLSGTAAYSWIAGQSVVAQADALNKRQFIEGDNRPVHTPDDRNLLSKALAIEPMDPALANALIMARLQTGKSGPDERDAMFAHLSKMGYRNNSAQYNLILNATVAADFDTMMVHIDAVLRRDVLAEQMYMILGQMEGDAKTAPSVRKILLKRPVWLTEYLLDSAALKSMPFLRVRLETLTLLNAAQPLRKSLYSVPANAAFERGDYNLATKFQDLYKNAPPAVEAFDAEEIKFPFEWKPMKGTGFMVSEETAPQRYATYWDGTGSPTLMQRYGSVSSAGVISIAVKGDNPSGLDLRVRQHCGRTSRLLPIEKGTVSYRFAYSANATCPVQKFEILAMPMRKRMAMDFAFTVTETGPLKPM